MDEIRPSEVSRLSRILDSIETSVKVLPAPHDHEESEWKAILDPVSQTFYYYNSKTGITQWQPPFADVSEKEVVHTSDGLKKNTLLSQPAWYKYMDSSSGKHYYHNPSTNVQQWNPPDDRERIIEVIYPASYLIAPSAGPGSLSAPAGTSTDGYAATASFSRKNGSFCATDGGYWEKVSKI
jgi:hypothetical protein